MIVFADSSEGCSSLRRILVDVNAVSLYIVSMKKTRQQKYQANNPEKVAQYQREYYAKNRARILERRAELRKTEDRKQKEKDRAKKWVRENPDRHRMHRRKLDRHRPTEHKIAQSIRHRVRRVLAGNVKSGKTIDLLGCTWTEFRKHIESMWLDGMSWENRKDWHIDHIIPCSAFDLSNPKHQAICFHHRNMRPIWAEENLTKGDTITDGFGQMWSKTCPLCKEDTMFIARPGRVRCGNCE
jgi:hypothetical protein